MQGTVFHGQKRIFPTGARLWSPLVFEIGAIGVIKAGGNIGRQHGKQRGQYHLIGSIVDEEGLPAPEIPAKE